jgi:FKBP-type peptidyl-prolyl cis-trans isomerase FkpA
MNQNATRALVPALGLVLAGMALAVEPAATMSAKQPASAAAASSPAEQDKTLYALGVMLSRGLDSFQLSEAEFSKVNAGLADGYHHKSSAAGVDAYMSQVQALQHSRSAVLAQHEKAAGQTYLAKAAAGAAGSRKTVSGLLYIPYTEGSGASPTRADQVKVNYEGRLIDGTIFDSSIKRGQAATMPLAGVIPCWTEALQLMKVGGKSRIICPSDLAYGDRGALPTIKPGATLEFDVELLEVAAAPPPVPAAQ